VIGEPLLLGAIHVKVSVGGLEEANVLSGAAGGLEGATAYRIVRVPGSALNPHAVFAQTDTWLVNPGVTAASWKERVVAFVTPHSFLVELQTLYPSTGTPLASPTASQEMRGKKPLKSINRFCGVSGRIQLVAIRGLAIKSV
jgi:hypothetical protein